MTNSSEYEGDIKLTDKQRVQLEVMAQRYGGGGESNNPFGPQNAVVRHELSVWKDRTLYYTIATNDQRTLNAIAQAMNEYRQRTCIRFVERTTQSDYVRFYKGTGYG